MTLSPKEYLTLDYKLKVGVLSYMGKKFKHKKPKGLAQSLAYNVVGHLASSVPASARFESPS